MSYVFLIESRRPALIITSIIKDGDIDDVRERWQVYFYQHEMKSFTSFKIFRSEWFVITEPWRQQKWKVTTWKLQSKLKELAAKTCNTDCDLKWHQIGTVTSSIFKSQH